MSDIINALLTAEHAVVECIAALQPTNDEERAKWSTLLDLRDQIADEVDQIVLSRVVAASKDLDDEAKDLAAVTTQIQNSAKTFATVDSIISATTKILQTVTEVATIVAGG